MAFQCMDAFRLFGVPASIVPSGKFSHGIEIALLSRVGVCGAVIAKMAMTAVWRKKFERCCCCPMGCYQAAKDARELLPAVV